MYIANNECLFQT